MNEIIDRVLRGEATPDEHARLAAWRQESNENEREFSQTVTLLEALSRARSRERLEPPTAGELLERMQRRRDLRLPQKRSWGSRWVAAGIAAGVVIVIASSLRSRTAPEAQPWQATEVVTGAGELATVQLPDGSVARLAPSSRLRLIASHDERLVSLEGRAFFAVARQPERPFRVRTRGGDALALGTRFAVTTEARGLRLFVLEGSVALLGERSNTNVSGGESAGVINGQASRAVALGDAASVVQWMGRFLAFQSTPLPRVATEIERMYGVRLVIEDSTLARETVSAAFTDEPFRQVVGVVCDVVGARCTITDSIVTISR